MCYFKWKLRLFSNFLWLIVGVIIDSKLMFATHFVNQVKKANKLIKVSTHIVNQVKKANRLMDLIWRSYNFLDIVSFKYLFISLVCPNLEYYVLVWYPLLKKDEDLIENIVRCATKIIPRLSNLTYEDLRDLRKLKYRVWNIVECVEIWSWLIRYWMDKIDGWNIYLLSIKIR